MGEEKKERELKLSWEWMRGYGQGDENKLYVQDWRNYGISARLQALRDWILSEEILETRGLNGKGIRALQCEGLSMHDCVRLAWK